MRRFWGRVRLRALFSYAVFGALLVAAILVIGGEIDHHIDAIEAWLREIRPWGALAYLALFVVLTSLFVPSTVLALIGGALFGLGWGTLAVVIGALGASSLQYVVSRRLLRDRIVRKLSTKPSLLAIQRAVDRHELRLQVLLRLTPLSPAVGSYLLGAAGVRFSGFFIACFALIPGLFLEVYFGHAGKHLTRMASRDEPSVLTHDVVIVGGLIVGIVVMVLVSRMARKAVQAAVAEVGVDAPASKGVAAR